MKIHHLAFTTFMLLTATAPGQDVRTIEARSAEVRHLHSLACTVQTGATTRSQNYRDFLTVAIRELRADLGTLKQQLQHSTLFVAVRGPLGKTLDSQLAALGEDPTDPCVAASEFVKLDPAPLETTKDSVPDVVISKRTIIFPDKEAGESAEASFSITNKGDALLSLEAPEICDMKGCCKEAECAGSKSFFFLPADEPCPKDLTKSEHCTVRVAFRPTAVGVYSAKVQWSDSSGRKSEVQLTGNGYVPNIVSLDGTGSPSTPSFRSVVGFDVSGASSARTEQKAFLEFDMNAPIGSGDSRDPLDHWLWGFFNPRITSLPQDSSALSGMNVQGFTDFFTAKKTDLVQGVDVQGGVEFLLLKPRRGIPFFSSYKHTRARTGIAFVVGAGFATPFSTPGNTSTVFILTPDSTLRQQYNIPASFTNIAFVNRERSRFFRKYYVGLRFKTYHFSSHVRGWCGDEPSAGNQIRKAAESQPACEALFNLFPGIIDLTAGQDEQVTGGHLSRWTLRVDAVYPLPFAPGFHIFGSLNSTFQRNKSADALILPATSTTPISDPSVFIVNRDPQNRDIYRIGLGVDILQLIKKEGTEIKQQ